MLHVLWSASVHRILFGKPTCRALRVALVVAYLVGHSSRSMRSPAKVYGLWVCGNKSYLGKACEVVTWEACEYEQMHIHHLLVSLPGDWIIGNAALNLLLSTYFPWTFAVNCTCISLFHCQCWWLGPQMQCGMFLFVPLTQTQSFLNTGLQSTMPHDPFESQECPD